MVNSGSGILRRLARAAATAALGVLLAMPLGGLAAELDPQAASAGGPTVLGTGSSFAAPALDQWSQQVNSLYGDTINYQTSSSVIGLQDYAQGQVNFAASEIGYSTGQSAYLPQSPFAPYQYLPDVAGAICMMFNVQSTTGAKITNLHLDAPTILKIFSGQITTWNNPAIAGLNPGVALPSAPLSAVIRSDPAGENYIMSDYFSTLYSSDWNAFTGTMGTPSGPQAIWPQPSNGQGGQHGIYNVNVFIAKSGSDAASQYVADTPNTITYVETAYAIEHNEPCAGIENPAGNFVQPSEQGDAIALTQDQLEPDLEQILTGVFLNPNPLSYPISAYSYLIMQESGQPAAPIGAVLGQFVQFVACRGQDAAGQLGYSPIPPNLVEDDFAAVNRLNGAAQLPTPTASNCPNPYLTGQLSLPGEPIQLGNPGAPGSTTGGVGGTGSTGGGAASGATAATGAGAAGSASSAATQAAIAAAAAHAAALAALAKAHAGDAQVPGAALVSEVGRLLSLPFSTGLIWLWVLALVGLFAVVPAVLAGIGRRRHRSASGEVKT
jgi:phosphate transport system substrate-binding protein